MNAFIENRCDHEVLLAIKKLASLLDCEIAVESVALEEGGLIKKLQLRELKKDPARLALFLFFLTAFFGYPANKLMDKGIDKLFENTEVKELEKEQLRLNVKKLRIELGESQQSSDDKSVIKRHVSQFYSTLEKDPDVEKVSFQSTDAKDLPKGKDVTVRRDDFHLFVTSKGDLDPVVLTNVRIEIIAPVLKKGKHKWMGMFEGKTINFSMSSAKFASEVYAGKIDFRSGSYIICDLLVSRKIDAEGNVKISGYDVLTVHRFLEDDTDLTPSSLDPRESHRYPNQIRLFPKD